MTLVERELGISERRACRALGQPRGTQRYHPQRGVQDADLLRRLHELAEEHPRFGYRRLAALIAAEGWPASRHRVERLCRAAGIRAAEKPRKRPPRHGPAIGRGARPDEVWCCDLLFDEDRFGDSLIWLAVLDEFTRDCVALRVFRRVNGAEVVAVLESIFGAWPEGLQTTPRLRTDNDVIWRSQLLSAWLKQRQITLCFTARGSPWQNGVVEAFFGRMREELPITGGFSDLAEAQAASDRWRTLYNTIRPHSALGYRTPQAVRKAWPAGQETT